VQRGIVPLQAATRSSETVTLPVNWPGDSSSGFVWLELRCIDGQGVALHERAIRLGAPLARTAFDPLLDSSSSAAPKLEESRAEFRVRHPGGEVWVNRLTGVVTLRDPQGGILASGLQPHAGRRLTEGEFVRAKKENPWTHSLLRAAAGLETSATHTPDGVALQIRGRYPRPGAPDQTLQGGINLLVRNSGAIDVSYDLVPTQAQGLLLEAGVAVLALAEATEFHWAGAGPYAGYPGKDALNEFGFHHLNRADLNFSGNRRGVEAAVLATPAGAGLLLIPEPAGDVAVEDSADGVVLSHNAVVAGRGTKFVKPDTAPVAEDAPRISGKFTLVMLAPGWAAPLTTWFGQPGSAKAFTPYFHSYDR
jgi:beta-galactosidase